MTFAVRSVSQGAPTRPRDWTSCGGTLVRRVTRGCDGCSLELAALAYVAGLAGRDSDAAVDRVGLGHGRAADRGSARHRLAARSRAVALPRPPVVPPLERACRRQMTLEPRAAGPRWVSTFAGGRAAGSPIPRPGACWRRSAPPRRSAKSRRATRARRTSPSHPRRSRQPADRASPRDRRVAGADGDGTHFYVDAGSGEVVARRTRFWRVYDFMWGLHIMDLQGREEPTIRGS